jgi:Ca2+-binding EF-hand superfamily protein
MLRYVDFQVVFYWTLIARYVCRRFDADPTILASVSSPLAKTGATAAAAATADTQTERLDLGPRQIELSKAQETQIREIFELFDTDGGGTMDRRELDMAMVALGFKAQPARLARGRKRGAAVVEEAMMQDGSVDLEEFTALMKGELGGRDPMEAVRAAFAYLSRHDGDRQSDGLITLGKLQAACKELEVSELL